MTLSTDIYIIDEVDPHKVFDFCNKVLLGTNTPITTEGPSKWDNDQEVIHLNNEPGQGLDAWLMAKYRKGGLPLYTEDEYDSYEDESWMVSPACYMKLDFDTAYGYQDEYGGCENLHGRYIVALYNWLLEQNVRMKWKNEFTGEIYDGMDGLESFLAAGDEANEWFRNTVQPFLGKLLTDEN